MGVTLWACAGSDRQAAGRHRTRGLRSHGRFDCPRPPGPPGTDSLPGQPPAAGRLSRSADEAAAERAATGELARDAAPGPGRGRPARRRRAADRPPPGRVAGLADGTEARRLVRKLQALYDQDGTAFQVEELAGGFQLLTRPEYHPWLVRLRRTSNELRLSRAARETLAIVAYRQPIMRADIEAIRGVHCGEMLRQLMEKGLVRIAGRHDSLGRPVLYGTTKKFLQVFGLKGLKDLPASQG